MRIAGIYPQETEVDHKIQHAVSEPYGLEMILAIAKQEGHEVDLFIPGEEKGGKVHPLSEAKLIEKIIDYHPDVAAFSLYTAQYPMGERIAAKLKERLPKVTTIAGNRYPTFLEENMPPAFDFFVIKEGEETFREWLRETEQGRDYEKVKGLVFRKDGKPVFTGERPRNRNLDSLPNALRFPIILNQVYRGVSLPTLSSNPHYAIMEYSRGCYNNCTFCDNEEVWGGGTSCSPKVTFRSPKRVVEEMRELKERGVDIFYFMDLNMTAFPVKTMQLCDEILSSGLKANWYCMSNILIPRKETEVLEAMKAAGCFKIAWGVESTNNGSLERMNKTVGGKQTTHEEAIRVLQSSLEKGILNQGYYIIGFPENTYHSIVEDAEKLKDMPLHQLNIGIFTPVPMSQDYNRLLAEGYTLDPDLENHNRNHLAYNHPSLDHRSLKELQQRIYREFYESEEYEERIRRTCEIDPRFARAFKEYFSSVLRKEMRIKPLINARAAVAV